MPDDDPSAAADRLADRIMKRFDEVDTLHEIQSHFTSEIAQLRAHLTAATGHLRAELATLREVHKALDGLRVAEERKAKALEEANERWEAVWNAITKGTPWVVKLGLPSLGAAAIEALHRFHMLQ